jgi:hypothetical protein
MAETSPVLSVPLGTEDNLASVMIYLPRAIYWGDIVIRKQFKPSTWLCTSSVPDILHLTNAKVIFESSQTTPKVLTLNELMIPSLSILAYHLVPPNFDPLDIDPDEKNMQMLKIDAFLGAYQFSGSLRISTIQTLQTYLEITHVNYLSLYDVSIQNTFNNSLGIVKVPYALLRKESTVFNTAHN